MGILHNLKQKRVRIFFFLVSMLVMNIITISFLVSNSNVQYNDTLTEGNVPNSSATYFGMIHVTNANWSDWVTNHNDTFSGFGTNVEPFTIKDAIIDAQSQLYGIFIDLSSSGVFFKIQNCTVFNSASAGINIFGSYNGNITNNTIYNANYGINITAGSENKMLIENNHIFNNSYGIFVNSADENIIRNNTIHSNTYGIQLQSAMSYNNTISSNYLYNNSFYGIYLLYPDFTEISNNTLYDNSPGRDAILIFGAKNSTIKNNYINSTKGTGIRLYNGANNSYVINNSIYNSSLQGIKVEQSYNSLLDNNSIYNTNLQLIKVEYSNNTIIKNGFLNDSKEQFLAPGLIAISDSYFTFIEQVNLRYGRNGIWAENSEYINSNYTVIDGTTQNALWYSNVNHTTIKYNSFKGGVGNGIKIAACLNVTVENNNISQYNDVGALFESNTLNFTVSNNQIVQNTHGIKTTDVLYGNIFLNNVSENVNYGIHSPSNLRNSTINNNTIIRNGGPGINFYSNQYNNVTFNNASFNQYGMYFWNSDNNLIKNNTFKNSSVQSLYVQGGVNNIFEGNNLHEPSVTILANASRIIVGMSVQFNCTVIGDEPISYYWDFKDTFTSSQRDPVHTFTSTGEYNVTLSILDREGENATAIFLLSVENDVVPIADFITNYTVPIYSGRYVNFTDNTTSGNPPLSYQWYFGDGKGNLTQASPIYQFNEAGVFAVVCTVTDLNGNASIWSITIEVLQNKIPIVEIITNATLIVVNEWVFFALTQESYTSGDAPLTIDWYFESPFDVSRSGNNHTFRFTEPGSHTVHATVNDTNGDIVSSSIVIIVELDTRPSAEYSWFRSASIPGKVVFTPSNDAGNFPLSFIWDFGDGTTSYERNPMHIYTRSGNYTVTLTVTDRNGDEDVFTEIISVSLEGPQDDPLFDWKDILQYFSIVGGIGAALYFIIKSKRGNKFKPKTDKKIVVKDGLADNFNDDFFDSEF